MDALQREPAAAKNQIIPAGLLLPAPVATAKDNRISHP